MIRAVALTGPTASGKTALSLHLARELGAEIVCCDSMQIYKRMDIGTAKATAEERAQARHHMLDFLLPTEPYSAQDYRRDAMVVAREISSRDKIPLFVGGTGLYLDSLMRGASETPESSEEYKEKILSEIKTEEDKERLWQRLCEVDPTTAAAVHKNNVRRVLRALEIYDATGKPKSYFDAMSKKAAEDIEIKHITLDFHDRELLYRRVDLRVEQMMREGLLSEVRELYLEGLLPDLSTAAQAIGYKELILHLRGELSLEGAVELLKQSTRRYAKRQLTWFRHNADAYRLFVDTEQGKIRPTDELLCEALKYLSGE